MFFGSGRTQAVFMNGYIPTLNTRVIIVTGHYGSGKTEFAVSLSMLAARGGLHDYPRQALVDLDITNPYFRSRDRRETLENAGIGVYGSVYKTTVNAEIPALSANTRIPLEDKDCFTIVDAGGNDTGARVLNQFGKYFTPDKATVLAVVNFNRFETRDVQNAVEYIDAIERATNLRVTAIVGNTHLLRETTADTIRRGYALTADLCAETKRALWCICYPEALVDRADIADIYDHLLPLGLYLRPSWLDK